MMQSSWRADEDANLIEALAKSQAFSKGVSWVEPWPWVAALLKHVETLNRLIYRSIIKTAN